MATTPTSHRTTITDDGSRVTVREWVEHEDRWVTQTYMASGGYVRIDDGRHYPQVCEMLVSAGPTLMCGSRERLVDVIRREYRRARAAARREDRRQRGYYYGR